MTNVTALFTSATDEQYEDTMMPVLIEAMQMLWAAADAGDAARVMDHKVIREISASLLYYVCCSMETLDSIRRDGVFDDNKLPATVASAIDSLAADYARAKGGEDSNELVEMLRTRRPTKMEPKI